MTHRRLLTAALVLVTLIAGLTALAGLMDVRVKMFEDGRGLIKFCVPLALCW